jgi:hypothetical protein
MNERTGRRASPDAATRELLDPELERRILALESSGLEAAGDFDLYAWLWILMLGVIGPALLLVWGWFEP